MILRALRGGRMGCGSAWERGWIGGKSCVMGESRVLCYPGEAKTVVDDDG
jgi:hypothetical protein